MSKTKKIGLIIIIVLAGGFVLSSLKFFIGPGFTGMLAEKIGEKMSSSQTVGQVTANQAADKLSITEITVPEWNQNTISSVIGKAYQIERLKDDGKPVAVEFSYDPAELGKGVAESSLRLFKRHSNGESGFWSLVPSAVDTSRHAVIAELSSFSILAVRAPLAYYLNSGEVAQIDRQLQSLLKKVPADTCGLSIIIEEELIEIKDGEIMEAYSRPLDEQLEYYDCIRNPSSPVTPVNFNFMLEREHSWNQLQTRDVSYNIIANVMWQTDHEESAVVKGAVVNQKNKPLEAVAVIANKQKYGAGQKKTVTDKDGKFELDLHSGEYALEVVPGGKNKNCVGADLTEKFFEFGALPDNLTKAGQAPYRHGPWNKTITLQCSEYYLDETLQLPIDSTVYGVNVKGAESAHVTGQLIQPISGGYGWEGVWEIEYQAKTNIKTSGVMKIMGGSIAMPSGAVQSQDHFKYKITIPLGAKAGDSFFIVGTRAGAGYKDSAQTDAGTLNVTANGGSASVNLGSGSSGEQSAKNVPINRTGKIAAVNGEDGLTLELFSMMSNDPPKVNIKHQQE